MKTQATFWDWLKAWSDEHSGLIALAALSLPVLIGCLKFAYAPKRWERLGTYFSDPASYPMLLKRYKSGGGDAYFAVLRSILLFATRVYGRKPFSRRAFGMCLTLAFLYPTSAMFLAWVIANVWQSGGLELFRDIASPLDRLWRAAALVVSLLTAFWIASNSQRFAKFIVAKLARPLDRLSAGAGAFVGALAGAVALAGAGAFAVAGADVVAFALALALALALAFAGAAAFAFAGAVAFALALAFAGDIEAASLLFLFYVILPTFNAFADFLSIAATRWFLRRVTRKRPSAGLVLLGVLADLIVAALCLSLLLGSLVLVLEAWGQLSLGTVPLDWRAYLTAIEQDKTQGIALYLMIGTTLLPTVIHLAAGLGAVLMHKRRQLRRVTRALEDQIALGVPFSAIERDAQVARIRGATFWGYGIAIVGVALVSYALGAFAIGIAF